MQSFLFLQKSMLRSFQFTLIRIQKTFSQAFVKILFKNERCFSLKRKLFAVVKTVFKGT
jgi:hypothetical protein